MKYSLVVFNESTYDSYTDARESGAVYSLGLYFDDLHSAECQTAVNAIYKALDCLDSNNGVVVFAVCADGSTGGHIFPADVASVEYLGYLKQQSLANKVG